jgi:alkaline phosphatase D
MKKIVAYSILALFCSFKINSQIKSGPMVGWSGFREALLWVQTEKEAKVKFNYWEQGKIETKKSTDQFLTEKSKAYAISIEADDAQPGKKYEYEVVINGKVVKRNYPLVFQTQVLWQYRTDPPPFTFAFGSCAFINETEYDRPGKPYGANYEIFNSIAAQKPDFMIWTGDNAYYREVDFTTKTGMLKRMTHSRSTPELQPLLGATHNFAIWDDHDYGPDNSDRSFVLKNESLEVFKTFWGNQNYVFKNEGITGTFEWADVQFFLIDDMWWKAPTERKVKLPDNGDYLGEKQLSWLIDALTISKASFKFVVTGGQILNPAKIFENMATFVHEREQLLKSIEDAKIPGVIFISGDRHHSVINKLERPGTYPLYDFTISPLTSGPSKPTAAEMNLSMVDSTLYVDRNFAFAQVSGPRKDRLLKIGVHDVNGKEIWKKEFKASELK